MEWKKTSEYTNANDVLIADYQRFLKKSTITIFRNQFEDNFISNS